MSGSAEKEKIPTEERKQDSDVASVRAPLEMYEREEVLGAMRKGVTEIARTTKVFVPIDVVFALIKDHVEQNYYVKDLDGEFGDGYAIGFNDDTMAVAGIVYEKNTRKPLLGWVERYHEKSKKRKTK
jgi:predicted GNAT superfamily acetyltransferase